MSTTPRTDAAWEQYNKDGNMHALAHKHKQLETELIAADWCEAFLETCKEIEK